MNTPEAVKAMLRECLAVAVAGGVRLGPYEHGLANSVLAEYECFNPKSTPVYEADPLAKCHCVIGAALLGRTRGVAILADAALVLGVMKGDICSIMNGWDASLPHSTAAALTSPWGTIGVELRAEFCPVEG